MRFNLSDNHGPTILGAGMKTVVKVYKKGIIVLPKSVREKIGIEEGSLLELIVEDDKIVLKPLNLWDRVWGCMKGRGSAEEAERELDREEEEFWKRRSWRK
jgi:AbrB family looped-hinge helix DNA binding protein